MPIIELPFRSVGPEPAMITAIGTRPLGSRGTTSVPGSSKAPLLIVYGDSAATAGGTVSAVCTASAMRARLRTIMLFPLPEDVRLHDRNYRDDENRGDDSGRNAPRGRNAEAATTNPPMTISQPPVRCVLRQTVSLERVQGVRIPTNQLGSTRVR